MVGFQWAAQAAIVLAIAASGNASTVRTNGPQMGWNSYNHYECTINKTIIVDNAKALVSKGLAKLGYEYVTPDCGWYSGTRDSSGALEWNTTRFPGGGKSLGYAIHKLGLKFGVYSGSGYWQCGSYNVHQGSIDHEQADANAFARWGADALKYDNCYISNTTVAADFYSEESGSSGRFRTMANALANVDRGILYQLCQWGVGNDLGSWGASIANSWRISVDIFYNWGSIWRITNQAIPFAKHAKVGAYPDLDMLIVGKGVLSEEEERMHFGLWSIFKSPLILGNSLSNPIPASSFKTISNKEVIAINQDSLGKSAELVRRYSEEGYDVYLGELSGDRMVLGLANWLNSTQAVAVNLPDVLGILSATARDVWAHRNLGTISGTHRTTLAGHQMQLLVLSNIKRSGLARSSSSYYLATEAVISGNASTVTCATGQCLPAGSKVTNIGSGPSSASVTFTGVYADTGGTKLLGVDFINYDIAWSSSWKRPQGTSTRNLTLSVNSGPAKRWAFPISGGNWFDTGRLILEVDGFEAGQNNTVEVKAVSGMSGFGPDLVGFELLE